MGACYSKKASGGNRSYTTVQMASTKLEEGSRLVRPTPYTRTQNANIDFAAKKSIPLPSKHNSLTTADQSDLKNAKNTFQSNIPRFSSSLPVSASISGEQKTIINDNEALHVVNNNAIVNSRSAFNVSNATSPVNKLAVRESQIKPKSLGSKSCPDKILSPDEKPSRTPLKGSGISRIFMGRSSPSSSQNSPETPNSSKMQQPKDSKLAGRNSSGPSPVSKSPSTKGFESRDSLSDFDSGLGNSLTDKNKPEDSDTIKDIEQLEFQDEISPSISVKTSPNRSTSTPKQSAAESKLSLKAPTYKREPNGKWSFDEKHFGPEPVRTSEPKPFGNTNGSSPKAKHSFKMNASENIFSTYASYKGLLSYQKKSFQPADVKFNLREKATQQQPLQQQSPNVSSIPKMKRQQSQPISSSGTIFYCDTDSNNCSFDDEKTLTNLEKPPQHQRNSSLDSDEKSDSTENGVLSPPSEENREFLIDDEIADQPGLTFFGDPKSEDSDVQSLQLAMSELHALQLASTNKRRTDSVSSYSSRKGRNDHRDSLILGSELGSSCSSIASDDLMLDYEKSFDAFPEGTVNEGPASPMRKLSEVDEVDKVAPLKSEKKIDFEEKRKRLHRRSSGPLSTPAERLEWRQRTVSLPLRPPRQMTVSEADDGGLKLDASSYRLLCQDLNGVKTLLLRLKSVIQEAETINPFDQVNTNNLFYHTLAQTDFPSSLAALTKSDDKKGPDISTIIEENADLRRQLVLLQQQLEDKDHTIHLLQQQMTKYLKVQAGCNHSASSSNAATQTERSHSLTGSFSSSSSADDSIETLVSVQDDFEKTFRKKSQEQDVLSEHLIEVVRLLDQTSNASPNHSEC
ncbi:hypothetical protein HNY73_009407 [Argiope bruennichi]|uniref:Uncharacterized protein n=1 Tax=Argiope bruennichi TaxID=94029 RepID=A0A8T0FC62_ARGBR|nr:hypothetical protein HNY73_009407 [Argiope bruennichi]